MKKKTEISENQHHYYHQSLIVTIFYDKEAFKPLKWAFKQLEQFRSTFHFADYEMYTRSSLS